jgi:hypothetical protein
MKPDLKGRFRSLIAELEAICLWDRVPLASGRTPDEYDLLSYRAVRNASCRLPTSSSSSSCSSVE